MDSDKAFFVGSLLVAGGMVFIAKRDGAGPVLGRSAPGITLQGGFRYNPGRGLAQPYNILDLGGADLGFNAAVTYSGSITNHGPTNYQSVKGFLEIWTVAVGELGTGTRINTLSTSEWLTAPGQATGNLPGGGASAALDFSVPIDATWETGDIYAFIRVNTGNDVLIREDSPRLGQVETSEELTLDGPGFGLG